jgi:hypothetical protein
VPSEHSFDRLVGRVTPEAHVVAAAGEWRAFFVIQVIDAEILRAHFDERLQQLGLHLVGQRGDALDENLKLIPGGHVCVPIGECDRTSRGAPLGDAQVPFDREKFCVGVVAGKTRTDAYLDAGYDVKQKSAWYASYRLYNRADVKERIDELGGKKAGHIAREQVAIAIKAGRPTLYREEICDMARRLALLGLDDEEMADALNIDPATMTEWKADHPAFYGAIQRGRTNADGRVAERAYHRALGYRAPAVKIMQHEGKPIIVPYTEHYPPDTTAAFKWLQNRQPAKWKDRQEINHSGSIEQRIMAMTPEERVQDAIELAERIRAHLARPDARLIEHEEGEEK